jgi:hypothetical protein
MSQEKISFDDVVLKNYKALVVSKYPDSQNYWPVISGHDVKIGQYQDYAVIFFKHTANSAMKITSGIGQISHSLVGVDTIAPTNIKSVRDKLEKFFGATASDCVLLVKHDMSNLQSELEAALQKHEYSLGLTPMKVFLSHKGVDKPKVREFKETLELLGFDPWLDEDAMHAGVELERAIAQGFKDSCAAVFFITPSYIDEKYLATEVDYAIAEKRKKGAKFSIITLVYEIDGKKGQVPDLLAPYVWKEPRNDLEAIRELIRALPVKAGDVYWK